MRKKLLTYGRHSNERIAHRIGELIEKEQKQSLEIYNWRLSYPNNFDRLLLPLRMLETFLIKIIKKPTCVYDIHQNKNMTFPFSVHITRLPHREKAYYSTTEHISDIIFNMFGELETIEIMDTRDLSDISDKQLDFLKNEVLDTVYNPENPNVFVW